jgi:hypothetical protein
MNLKLSSRTPRNHAINLRLFLEFGLLITTYPIMSVGSLGTCLLYAGEVRSLPEVPIRDT